MSIPLLAFLVPNVNFVLLAHQRVEDTPCPMKVIKCRISAANKFDIAFFFFLITTEAIIAQFIANVSTKH